MNHKTKDLSVHQNIIGKKLNQLNKANKLNLTQRVSKVFKLNLKSNAKSAQSLEFPEKLVNWYTVYQKHSSLHWQGKTCNYQADENQPVKTCIFIEIPMISLHSMPCVPSHQRGIRCDNNLFCGHTIEQLMAISVRQKNQEVFKNTNN